jgi:hypothetical protein
MFILTAGDRLVDGCAIGWDECYFGMLNYLPSGSTSLLFALLANYYAAIPYTYPLPRLARLAPIHLYIYSTASNQYLDPLSNHNKQSNVLSRTAATRTLPIPQLPHRCGSRMGGRDRVSPGFTTWCCGLEGAWWAVGVEGESERAFEGLRARW